MADSKRILRQWLETDAAFGVNDVPLKARRSTRNPAEPPAKPVAKTLAAPAATALPARPVAHPTTPPPRSAPQPAQPALLPGAQTQPTPRKKTATPLPPIPAGDIAALPPFTRRQKETALAALLQQIETASKPYLNEISTRVVFGEGDPDAEILFVGEGPGIEEDRSGRPFVGRSGQLLDKMITAIGYKRDPAGGISSSGGVFIANVVKLRAAEYDPTTNKLTDRPPSPEEVARGLPSLHQQIEIIRPKVIVTLGAPAVKYLTGTTEGVTKIRGTWLSYRGVPVMPTYHPAFVLRAYTEENRRKVWSDLQLAQKRAKGT